MVRGGGEGDDFVLCYEGDFVDYCAEFDGEGHECDELLFWLCGCGFCLGCGCGKE